MDERIGGSTTSETQPAKCFGMSGFITMARTGGSGVFRPRPRQGVPRVSEPETVDFLLQQFNRHRSPSFLDSRARLIELPFKQAPDKPTRRVALGPRGVQLRLQLLSRCTSSLSSPRLTPFPNKKYHR
jgi:hypothetical protein